MNDERFERDVAALVKSEDRAPTDPPGSVRRAVGVASRSRQLSRRWWLPPFIHRLPSVPPETSNVDDPATGMADDPAPRDRPPDDDGPSPITGRTRTMFSPASAMSAVVVVFIIGAALLFFRAIDQGPVEAPGVATIQLERPVPFTASMHAGPQIREHAGPQIREPACEHVDGVTHCHERGDSWFIAEISEPMLDGTMLVGESRDQYPGNRSLTTWTYRIENEDGAWQGSVPTSWFAGTNGSHSVLLEGEGAYDGLNAWLDMSDWSDVNGVVFPAPPPEKPTAAPGTREIALDAAVIEIERPEPFTAVMGAGPMTREPVCEHVDGLTRCRERGSEWFMAEMSDSRLDGDMLVAQSRDQYADNRWLVSYTFRIETDDGAWQGSVDTSWFAGDFGAFSVFLEGEGAYEGLHAWMDLTDRNDVKGVVFPAPPPVPPTVPEDTLER